MSLLFTGVTVLLCSFCRLKKKHDESISDTSDRWESVSLIAVRQNNKITCSLIGTLYIKIAELIISAIITYSFLTSSNQEPLSGGDIASADSLKTRPSRVTHPLFIQFEELLWDLWGVDGQSQTVDVELGDDVFKHLF